MSSPTKQAKLKELLNKLEGMGEKKLPVKNEAFQLVSPDFFDTLNSKLDSFKEELSLTPIIDMVKSLQAEMKKSEKELQDNFQAQLGSLSSSSDLVNGLSKLQTEFGKSVATIQEGTTASLKMVEQKLQDYIDTDAKEDATEKKELDKKLKDIRAEVATRIASIGGGAMNRKVTFNGTDRLTRYTDINWKAGNNVTFTIANNNTTKMVDVTVSATGGSGSGIVRSIQSISLSQAADASATTDYIYLCSGTLTLTLPDATTNSNLYTIKNVGNGTVTVATTSSQTIDGSLTITLPTKYTSVDIASDTANWNVT